MERARAVAESAELREKVEQLKAELSPGKRQKPRADGALMTPLFPLIAEGAQGADGFTVECCRRLVEEAKLSFQQAGA